MLDDYATARLADLAPGYMPLEELSGRIARGEIPTGSVMVAPLSLGGSANARIIGFPPSSSSKSAEFLAGYYKYNKHISPPQNVIFLNRPCYIVPATGTVFLDDGRLLLDTVYPSSGENSFARLIGGGITPENLAVHLKDADELGDGAWAPLLSRWSDVYFHAVSESMVHDVALRRAGLSAAVSYVVPAKRSKVQELVLGEAGLRCATSTQAIVKAPRVVLSTLLYGHSIMGVDFLNFVGHAKIRSLMGWLPLSAPANHRIYVSRFGAKARRMLNEQALVDALKPLGFRIIAGESLPFGDQVRTFANANFVVGAHGAGLVNAAFARPNSTLFELRPLNRYGDSPMWGMSYIKLSSIMGFAYCAHVSENEPDSEEWVADLDEILQQIRALLA